LDICIEIFLSINPIISKKRRELAKESSLGEKKGYFD
jgi:hypothetical protein